VVKEEKMKKIEAIKEEYSAKIKDVLTDEQKVKYEEMKAERMKGSDHEHMGSDKGVVFV